MSRNPAFFLLFAALLGACASKDKVCPADNQSACMDSTLSYDGSIGALLTERCSPCHAAGGVESTILLTDFNHVSGEKMSITGQLLTCSMPPDGSPQLTSDERNQILDWLSCGAPK